MALGPQALTTVSALRAQLAGGATDDSTGRLADASLEALIERASAAIESYCDRVLLAPTDDQTYRLDGNGEQRLALPEWPIAALSSLRVDGESIAPRGDGPSGYVAREAEGWLELRGHTFSLGLLNVEVVGRLGYDPVLALSQRRHRLALADLEAACLLLCGHWHARPRAALAAQSGGGVSDSYEVAPWPAEVRGLLAPYRRLGA